MTVLHYQLKAVKTYLRQTGHSLSRRVEPWSKCSWWESPTCQIKEVMGWWRLQEADGAGKRQIYDVDKSLKLLWSFWPQPGWNSSWSKCSWWGSPRKCKWWLLKKLKLKSYLGLTNLSLNGVQLGHRVFVGDHLDFKWTRWWRKLFGASKSLVLFWISSFECVDKISLSTGSGILFLLFS